MRTGLLKIIQLDGRAEHNPSAFQPTAHPKPTLAASYSGNGGERRSENMNSSSGLKLRPKHPRAAEASLGHWQDQAAAWVRAWAERRRARKRRAPAYLACKALGLQVGGWSVSHSWLQPEHLQTTECFLLPAFSLALPSERSLSQAGCRAVQPLPRAGWWFWVQETHCQPLLRTPAWPRLGSQ